MWVSFSFCSDIMTTLSCPTFSPSITIWIGDDDDEEEDIVDPSNVSREDVLELTQHTFRFVIFLPPSIFFTSSSSSPPSLLLLLLTPQLRRIQRSLYSWSFFPLNHLLRAEIQTPKQTMTPPTKLVQWTTSLLKKATWNRKAIRMSMVRAKDTNPASSILRETVRHNWPKTPHNPFAMSHRISSGVSGIPTPFPAFCLLSDRNEKDVLHKLYVLTTIMD